MNIKRIMEHEPDGAYFDRRTPGVECPLRWQVVMAQILQLPVAPRDCPATAAGEIDTEKGK